MKNHKLLSAPSHKTITQAKEKHNFAAKMITWLLNHSARDVVYDVTPPPHKLNQAKDTSNAIQTFILRLKILQNMLQT